MAIMKKLSLIFSLILLNLTNAVSVLEESDRGTNEKVLLPDQEDDKIVEPVEEEEGVEEELTSSLIANCRTDLLPGQYLCRKPALDVDTQQPIGNTVVCKAVPGISCRESGNRTFTKSTSAAGVGGSSSEPPLPPTNGYDFDTALLLSGRFSWR